MTRLVYAAHQPDLLPYSGFFHKLAKADLFDLKIWDQFVAKGYQRRVKMVDQWVNLPLVKGDDTAPIVDRRLKPGAARELVKQVERRYLHARKKPPHWDERAPELLEQIGAITTDRLWEFNFELILMMRERLGISTPIVFTHPIPRHLRGSAGIVHLIESMGTPACYLSGTGAKGYMGDCREFTEADIPVMWSRHRPVTGDSILTVYFDHEDPLDVVLAENPAREESAA